MVIPFLKAFLVGGMICLIGQLLIDFTKITPGRILVSFVVIGVVLGAVGVYEPLVKFASSGATVPLTGFGYALSQGVREAVGKDGITGVFSGGLSATSAGITAAVLLGLILSVIAKPKDKS